MSAQEGGDSKGQFNPPTGTLPVKDVVQLALSTAWNKKVQNDFVAQQQYTHLFEMKAPYQASVLDGISLVANEPLTSGFTTLVRNSGTHKYLPASSPYNEAYSLGCLTLLTGPKFPKVASHLIKINPSEAGLCLQQVIEWGKFAVGDASKLNVRRVDFKVDSYGVHPSALMDSVWITGVRKVNALYNGQSLYLGGKHSSQSFLVYDKATQLKSKGIIASSRFWTRIELRRKYKGHEQKNLAEFIRLINSYDPFKKVVQVTADKSELNNILKRYNKKVLNNNVIQTLKSLTSYQRSAVLKRLDNDGKLRYISNKYDKQLKNWLQY